MQSRHRGAYLARFDNPYQWWIKSHVACTYALKQMVLKSPISGSPRWSDISASSDDDFIPPQQAESRQQAINAPSAVPQAQLSPQTESTEGQESFCSKRCNPITWLRDGNYLATTPHKPVSDIVGCIKKQDSQQSGSDGEAEQADGVAPVSGVHILNISDFSGAFSQGQSPHNIMAVSVGIQYSAYAIRTFVREPGKDIAADPARPATFWIS